MLRLESREHDPGGARSQSGPRRKPLEYQGFGRGPHGPGGPSAGASGLRRGLALDQGGDAARQFGQQGGEGPEVVAVDQAYLVRRGVFDQVGGFGGGAALGEMAAGALGQGEVELAVGLGDDDEGPAVDGGLDGRGQGFGVGLGHHRPVGADDFDLEGGGYPHGIVVHQLYADESSKLLFRLNNPRLTGEKLRFEQFNQINDLLRT